MTTADISSSQTDDHLAALAAALVGPAETRPAWVWHGNGSSLIWANKAGLETFGADSLQDLAALEVTPTKPAGRSLVAIARTPVGAGGRGRIEILRIATARHQETLVAICKPVALGDEIAVLAIASGPNRSAQAVPVAQLRPASSAPTPIVETVVDDAPEITTPLADPPAPTPVQEQEQEQEQETDFNLSIAEEVADTAPTEISTPIGPTFTFKPRSRPHRFSFLVNQDGKIRALSSGLADAVGSENSLQDGDDAVEALARLAHDVEPAVRNAIAERRRFSEHSMLWPVSGHDVDVLVRLSGFDEDDGELRVFGTVLTGKAQKRGQTSAPLAPLAPVVALTQDDAQSAGLFAEPESEAPSQDAADTPTTGEPVALTAQIPGGAALAAAASAITAGIAGGLKAATPAEPLNAVPEPSKPETLASETPAQETAVQETPVPVVGLDDQLADGEAQAAGLWADDAAEVAFDSPALETPSAPALIPLDDDLTSSEAEAAGLWSDTPSASDTSSPSVEPSEESVDGDDPDAPESTRKAMAAVAAGLAAGLAAGPIRNALSTDQNPSRDEPPVFVPADAPVQEDDGLSRPERLTFQEIARRLGARITGHDDEDGDLNNDGLDDDAPENGVLDDTHELSAASPFSADIVALSRAGEDASEEDPQEPSSSAQVLAFNRTEPNAERMVLDRLPLGVIIYHERTILYANRAALEISGRPSLDDLKNEDGVESLFAQSAGGLDNDDGSMVLLRPDDTRVAVAGRLQSVRWDGQAAAMLSIREQGPLESEEREQAHDAALTSAAAIATADALPLVRARIGELEAIVDLASDGVVTLDGDGEIKDLNQAAQALVGYSADDLIGRPFRLLFAEDSRQTALDYLDDIAEQGHLSLFNEGREVECLTAQGGLVPVFMTLGRLTDDQPPAFCAVLRDLSPFKQAETDLVAARRAAEEASAHKSDFLARVSHEIRTPLNAVIGFSEVMLEERFGPVGSERYRQYLRDIHTSGEHLMSLLNDLLDLSKIEAGKMELSFGEVDLNDVVQQCLAIMQPQANQGRIIVRTSLPLSVPKVVADIRSVRQIALNLMSNAIKFTDPGGQIIVSTLYEPSGEVSLRVRDTGRGMDAADVKLALEPFRQVPTTLNQVITGTGLGLPLTKALVEANRAQFELDSTPGEGTLAKVTFPLQRVLAE